MSAYSLATNEKPEQKWPYSVYKGTLLSIAFSINFNNQAAGKDLLDFIMEMDLLDFIMERFRCDGLSDGDVGKFEEWGWWHCFQLEPDQDWPGQPERAQGNGVLILI